MSSVINIGGHLVGPGHPTLVIAEAGSNHNRDLVMAKRLIDVAATAGADAVKFQCFSADKLYSKYTPKFSYLEAQGEQKETWDIIKDAELPREWQQELFDYATANGLIWLSTPTDREGVDQLEAIGVPAYKISSYEAVDLPFVKYVTSKGKPMIISTGMCSNNEVADIINTVHSVVGDEWQHFLAFLQCTSLYPAPYHLVNLKWVPAIGQLMVTGLSDHTTGIHIPVAAVALGACIIEKHFTLDRNLPGPDHPHSLEPDELAQMVRQIRDVESAMGDGRKTGPAPEEQEMFQKARRSVVAACDIPAGTTITADMVTSKRPGYGVPAKDIDKVIGMTTSVSILEDQVITWLMV